MSHFNSRSCASFFSLGSTISIMNCFDLTQFISKIKLLIFLLKLIPRSILETHSKIIRLKCQLQNALYNYSCELLLYARVNIIFLRLMFNASLSRCLNKENFFRVIYPLGESKRRKIIAEHGTIIWRRVREQWR